MKKLAYIFLLAGLYSCGNKDQDKAENNQTLTTPENPPPAASPAPTQKAEQVKIPVYNNVNALRAALSENEIGQLGEWKSDGMDGYMSVTDYYQFGKGVPKSDIMYSMESKSPDYVQTITLAMNINAKTDRKEAMRLFKATADKTFKRIDVEIPLPVAEAIGYGKNKSSDNKQCAVTFKVDKGNIEIWTLKIKTK